MAEPTPTVSREEVKTRRISTEEKVGELLDRANRFRTDLANPLRVASWSETIEALSDLLEPWALEEDRDAKLQGKRGQFMQEWDDRPVAYVTTPRGRLVVPTAADCRTAQRILTGLLDRQGLLVKRRTVSGPGPRNFASPPTASDEIPVSEP